LDSELRSNPTRKLQQIADPDGYAFIPVHQWQYQNWLGRIFARDIAVSKNLAYIVRQGPYRILSPDEIPIVTVARVDNNRLTDKPLIHSLIRTFAGAFEV
jgi:hypothetical protein